MFYLTLTYLQNHVTTTKRISMTKMSCMYSVSGWKSAKNILAVLLKFMKKLHSCYIWKAGEWKVSLVFGKEHSNWSNISEVAIGCSWKIKFVKINYFLVTPILSFPNLTILTSSYHNSINTGPIDMIFTEKCNYFSWATRWNHSFLSQSQ